MTLRLIDGNREPWEQQIGEDDGSYSAFVYWLMKKPRCSIAGAEIAIRFDWGPRAQAYDNTQSVMGRPRDLIEKAFQPLMQVVAIESKNLLERVRKAPEGTNVLTPKELKELLECIVANKQHIMAADPTADQDLTQYSELELRIVQAAHGLLASKRLGPGK